MNRLISIIIVILAIIVLLYSAPKAHAYTIQGDFPSSKLDIIKDVTTKLVLHEFDLLPETGRFTCSNTDRALGCYSWTKTSKKIKIDQTLEDRYFKNVLLHEIGHYLYNSKNPRTLWEISAWEFMYDFRRTFDEVTGPEVKIVKGNGYLIAGSGVYDLGLITARDIIKIKNNRPFITKERKQKIAILPAGEIYSLEDVRSGEFSLDLVR